MAISVDWGAKVITVPKADMTLLQSTPIEVRELDLFAFHLSLIDLEDGSEGQPFLDTHKNTAPVDIGGVTLARVIEIINGYTVTFEDGSYVVSLTGANSNLADRVNPNNVSVRSTNSAGLIVSIQGSGVTAQDKLDIASGVWTSALEGTITAEELMRLVAAASAGKLSGAAGPTVRIRSVDDVKERITATVDADGNRTGIVTDVT